MNNPNYKIYPSLLDAYQWYLGSEADNAFQDIIDRINRVRVVSDAADKGTALNNLIDDIVLGKAEEAKDGKYSYGGFEFSESLCNTIAEPLKNSISQVRTSATIDTRHGLVEIYGIIDYLLPFCHVVDLKGTKKYEVPKFNNNWQHIVYPYCLNQKAKGDWKFTYLITDYKGIFEETYTFNEQKDTLRLKVFIEQFIDFLEEHRDKITDTKIFGIGESSQINYTNEV